MLEKLLKENAETASLIPAEALIGEMLGTSRYYVCDADLGTKTAALTVRLLSDGACAVLEFPIKETPFGTSACMNGFQIRFDHDHAGRKERTELAEGVAGRHRKKNVLFGRPLAERLYLSAKDKMTKQHERLGKAMEEKYPEEKCAKIAADIKKLSVAMSLMQSMCG